MIGAILLIIFFGGLIIYKFKCDNEFYKNLNKLPPKTRRIILEAKVKEWL